MPKTAVFLFQRYNVQFVNDFVVIVDAKLKLNYHIDYVVFKCSKTLGFLKRSTKGIDETRSLIILY